MTLVQDLEGLGLTEREASSYLALADLGKATAQLLSKRTKLPRASIYLLMESLSVKGLVTKETKAATTYFIPSSPSALTLMLRREAQNLRRKMAQAERLQRELEPIFRGKNYSIPRLKLVEGAESIESMLYQNEDLWYESMKQNDSTWWGFEDVSLFKGYQEWFERMWDKFSESRRKQIKLRIFSNFPVAKDLEKRFPLTKIRPLPSQYDFSSTTWLMGDYLVLFSTREKPFYGYQIHDPVLTKNLRIIFALLWKEEV
jgi:sugar-specific transcriptional regulator TrmB